MIEIIWGILNVIVIIYFIIICFKSVRAVRDKLGALASLIFALGLLSFIGKSNEENQGTKTFNLQEENVDPNKFDGNTYLRQLILENKLATNIELGVKFGENGAGKKLLSAYTTRTGFVSGTNWVPQMVSVDKSDKSGKSGKYNYYVTGTFEWRILGIKLYSENKNFEGEIKLNK